MDQELKFFILCSQSLAVPLNKRREFQLFLTDPLSADLFLLPEFECPRGLSIIGHLGFVPVFVFVVGMSAGFPSLLFSALFLLAFEGFGVCVLLFPQADTSAWEKAFVVLGGVRDPPSSFDDRVTVGPDTHSPPAEGSVGPPASKEPETGPLETEGQEACPPEDEGPDTSPPEDEGPETAPPEDGGTETAPPEDEGPKTAPSEDEGPETAPPEDEGPETAPPEDEGFENCPPEVA